MATKALNGALGKDEWDERESKSLLAEEMGDRSYASGLGANVSMMVGTSSSSGCLKGCGCDMENGAPRVYRALGESEEGDNTEVDGDVRDEQE